MRIIGSLLLLVGLTLNAAPFVGAKKSAFSGTVPPAGGSPTVTLDASQAVQKSAAQVGGLTNSFTVGTGLTDGYIIVAAVVSQSVTVPTITQCRYGTLVLSQLSTVGPNNDVTSGRIYMFGGANPASGANNVEVTLSGNTSVNGVIEYAAASFSRVSSASAATPAFGSGTSPAITMTCSSGDLLVAWAGLGSPMSAWAANDIVHSNGDQNSGCGNVGLSDNTATSNTFTWTGTSDFWGVLGVRLVHD